VRIVAIGGGELPRPGRSKGTTELDAEVVRLAGVRAPRLIFLPTGHGDDVAAAAGTVMTGISAGAICWCAAGVSDARSFSALDDAWDDIHDLVGRPAPGPRWW
jgi:hypothetical protein